MKKTLLTLVLAVLCLNFGNIAHAQVQPETSKAIASTTKGIQTGQRLPDIPSLSKYKGKFIILDFWATWCSPCIAMIPKMEALQTQFKNQLQIIQVTYQSEQEVTTFLNKLNKGNPPKLPQVIGDKELHKLFPHTYLPHYIWIDKNGTVVAITDQNEVTAINIQRVLESVTLSASFKQKEDEKRITFDTNKSIADYTSPDNISYQSLLTHYIPNIGRGLKTPLPDSTKALKFSFRNLSLRMLYARAFAERKMILGTNRTIYEVRDSSRLVYKAGAVSPDQWSQENLYCYELKLPPHLATQAWKIMQRDLQLHFPQYRASLQFRKRKCLVLLRSSSLDKIGSGGGQEGSSFNQYGFRLHNFPLIRLIAELNGTYMSALPYPVLDETNYKGRVDITLQANLGSVAELNEALKKYDLELQLLEREIPVLVIAEGH